jgi:hypothetical protein
MYSIRSNYVLGFHGCEEEEQNELLISPKSFKSSQENYDWLGHGMYFWEDNVERAWKWAKLKKKAGTLKKPAVIGAVINLGYCFDLLDSQSISILEQAFLLFKEEADRLANPIPKNVHHPSEKGNDRTLRYLDCAVIEFTHQFFKSQGEHPFDSVRAAFIEGNPIYEGAGFYDKTHIQICIINPNCIKGFFLPREKDKKFLY